MYIDIYTSNIEQTCIYVYTLTSVVHMHYYLIKFSLVCTQPLVETVDALLARGERAGGGSYTHTHTRNVMGLAHEQWQ